MKTRGEIDGRELAVVAEEAGGGGGGGGGT